MDFSGQMAIITGAARGVGRATAHLLAQRGAKVALIDVDYEKLESVRSEIEEYTKDVLIYKCDVSDEKRVNEVMADIIEKYGRADILVQKPEQKKYMISLMRTVISFMCCFLQLTVIM